MLLFFVHGLEFSIHTGNLRVEYTNTGEGGAVAGKKKVEWCKYFSRSAVR